MGFGFSIHLDHFVKVSVPECYNFLNFYYETPGNRFNIINI